MPGAKVWDPTPAGGSLSTARGEQNPSADGASLSSTEVALMRALVSGAGNDIGALTEPWCIAHRGAGAMMGAESTLPAYLLGASYGPNYVVDGGDWYHTSDGAVFDIHDTTLDATTTLTGAISAQTQGSMRRACTIDASAWFGFGWSDQVGALTPELLFTALKGRCISPEPKSLTAANYLAQYLHSNGWMLAAIPTAFQDSYLAPFAALGFPYLARNVLAGAEHTTLADPVLGPARCAALLALGIRYIIVDWADANAIAATAVAKAAGMKVGAYSAGTAATRASHLSQQAQLEEMAPYGLAFYVSDDPVYFMGDTAKYRRRTDPYQLSGGVYHGHHDRFYGRPPFGSAAAIAKHGTISGGRFVLSNADTLNNFVLQGWACPLAAVVSAGAAASYTITVDIKFTALATDKSRWAGVVVCCPNDKIYTDSGAGVGNTGYQIWVRPSTASGGGSPGDLNIVEKTDGAGGTVTTSALSAEITAGGTIRLVIAVSPTAIVVTASNAATGTVTMTDATNRGPYFHVGHASVAAGTLTTEFGPITIT